MYSAKHATCYKADGKTHSLNSQHKDSAIHHLSHQQVLALYNCITFWYILAVIKPLLFSVPWLASHSSRPIGHSHIGNRVEDAFVWSMHSMVRTTGLVLQALQAFTWGQRLSAGFAAADVLLAVAAPGSGQAPSPATWIGLVANGRCGLMAVQCIQAEIHLCRLCPC